MRETGIKQSIRARVLISPAFHECSSFCALPNSENQNTDLDQWKQMNNKITSSLFRTKSWDSASEHPGLRV